MIASSLAGCNASHDPKPDTISDADVLMQANGYWEWESSGGFRWQRTPASVGFSRQLVFKSDGKVHIYHNRQPELQAAYQLSTGVHGNCQPPQPQPVAVPMVRYTAETQFPNSDLRTYGIALSAIDTTLYIAGLGLCVDIGAAERYRWRSK
ncbi:hypothetical protein BEN47_06350 [Hymenobacter lapidarius]|uniref:Lipocalin-like domain-containing protein n=1 Tax=Hymenobacter lapidarius TaxID=1908237 RepID=A0A1G1SQG9_9BACT|nr:hypothetical protein [Hymenobacter lapidarius]OGX80871.1 hypothetical protein BEN47_06350 [Hymenobacter lapidarius]